MVLQSQPLDADALKKYGLITEPGIIGVFTRAQADGAIPNGARVVKVKDGEGDNQKIGSYATVLGSVKAPNDMPQYGGMIMYWVLWDSNPQHAIAVGEWKIAKAD